MNQGTSRDAQSLRHIASRGLQRPAFDRDGADIRTGVLVTIQISIVLPQVVQFANQTASWPSCLASRHDVARKGAEFHNFV